jgi:uncharacterized damage-inducible protein DinB
MDPRYPIGRFDFQASVTMNNVRRAIDDIAATPARMREAVAGLSDDRLDTPYREGGWTVRQVVHHVADSHLNAYIRFRLGLTENEPTIKPYDQAAWAGLADARSMPVEVSLVLLESLHSRWVVLLQSITADDFRRAIIHPENGRLGLDRLTALYGWHGRHHVAHVTTLRERMNW